MKPISVSSVLNKHKKPDPWFLDYYSVNPYSGCYFNCLYCYIRGSKYGNNLTQYFSYKQNAPEILEKQLARQAKKKEYGIILISSATDPYPPAEKELKLTRQILKVILKYRFPVHIMTKSTLILRDIDILKQIEIHAILPKELKTKLKKGVIISFSFSTLDKKISQIFEPLAPPPKQRLETLQKCHRAGFLTGANFIPILPFFSDSSEKLERMIKTAKKYQADFVLVGALTLFGNKPGTNRFLFYKTLRKHFPKFLPKYKKLFRVFSCPPKEYQQSLEKISKKLCQKYKIKCGIL